MPVTERAAQIPEAEASGLWGGVSTLATGRRHERGPHILTPG
jgi:hypothetical protein